MQTGIPAPSGGQGAGWTRPCASYSPCAHRTPHPKGTDPCHRSCINIAAGYTQAALCRVIVLARCRGLGARRACSRTRGPEHLFSSTSTARVPCHRSQVKSEVLRQVSYGVHQAYYANKWCLTRAVSLMLLNILHQGTPSNLFEMWYLNWTMRWHCTERS